MIAVAQPCPKQVDWSDQDRSFWDPHSHSRIVAATPQSRPDLWSQFIDGADASYRRYGVSSALEFDNIKDGASTSIFISALDDDGTMLGGMRAQGPYSAAEQSHASVEWQGHSAGRADLLTMIEQRLPCGVLEMKTGWVAAGAPRARDLVLTIGHSPFFAMTLMNARFALCTAAAHVLDAWTRTGAVVASHIDAIPYPDDRYRTNLIWWDRDNFGATADPEQSRRIRSGTDALTNTVGNRQLVAS